uniref:Uncharacterized protein LOC104247551 n=1 Tax=Nicotiana sylvestris TaxID=4096 RepID=A0A1U7YSV8_NICSY|nr:PREDICTED: uncharacterized protein LOC104247551 [Nicotiana sylvestris]
MVAHYLCLHHHRLHPQATMLARMVVPHLLLHHHPLLVFLGRMLEALPYRHPHPLIHLHMLLMTQTQTFEEVVSYDALHRLIIIPDGTTRFVPSNESTKVIMDCVKEFYRVAWSKWSDIPYIYVNQMWNQFRALKFYKARLDGKMSDWILKDIWDKLNVIWASEEFKKRSNAGKAALASNTGGS